MSTTQQLDEREYAPKKPSRWYALHTRSHFEARVAGELHSKGLHTYLPAIEEIHQWKDRKKKLQVPLFPGYVFVQFPDIPKIKLTVLQTAGVVRILGHGNVIEYVPDEQIIAVHGLLAAKLPCSVHPFLKQGDWVRMRRGVLQGLEGFLVRVKNRSRLVISIPVLLQSVSAEVDARDAEPIRKESFAQAS